MKKEVSIIVQARTSSSRLPGKVMYSLAGKPVLEHILDRLSLAKNPRKIIVATSTDETDDPIEELVQRKHISVYRGSLKNVLSRYYHTAKQFQTEHIMRICADNPFVDPVLIDAGIEKYVSGDYQYLTCRNVPLGLGYWILPFTELEKAYQNADKPEELEHVMPYTERTALRKGQYVSPIDYSAYYLTMDTPIDWTRVQDVYQGLYHGTHNFFMKEIVAFMDSHHIPANPYRT